MASYNIASALKVIYKNHVINVNIYKKINTMQIVIIRQQII